MTANAFTSVSLDPPLVLVSIDNRARMHTMLPSTRRYGVSVLASEQERLACTSPAGPTRPPGPVRVGRATCPSCATRSRTSGATCSPPTRRATTRSTSGRSRTYDAARGAAAVPSRRVHPRRRPSRGRPGADMGLVPPAAPATISRSRRSRSRSPTGARRGSPRARSSTPTTCSCACTPTPGWSARPRRSRARTPTARASPRSSTPCAHAGPAVEGSTRSSPSGRRALRRDAGNRVARGAVDLAIWDLVGQLLGGPCATLLGGYAPDVEAAHMVSFGTPHAMAEEALAMHARHGRADVQGQGRARVAARRGGHAAIRAALPDADLYVDANRGWSFAAALRAGDELIALGVRAIEEPISIEDRPAGRGSPSAGRSRSSATRAASASRTSSARSPRARSGWSASRSPAPASPSRAGSSTSAPPTTSRSWSASQYEGGLGAMATVAFAVRVRRHRGRPGRDHELPRPGRRSDRGRRRSAPAAWRRARGPGSGSRSTRTAWSTTGWTDAVHGRDAGALAAGHDPEAAATSSSARARVLPGGQRDGRWPHLWRVAGRYANVSVLDVGSVDELHELLSGLPLFPYMDIRVTPLARHPTAIDRGEKP